MQQMQAFKTIAKASGFQVSPAAVDLHDSHQFHKLETTPEQMARVNVLLGYVPSTLASGTLANAYIAKFPEGLPHALTQLKQGGYGSMLRENGKFIGTASFYPLQPQAIALGAFTAMSAVTGQYFMAQINSQLKIVNTKMDKIIDFLYGDKKAELLSEINFVQYAYQNYSAIMSHEAQRLATIVSLQEAKNIAMKDIEFYIYDLDSKLKNPPKSLSDLEALYNEAQQIKSSLEASIQLYVTSSIMEVHYAQNYDVPYLKSLKDTVSWYIDKCEKRILSSFGTLNGFTGKFNGKKLNATAISQGIETVIHALHDGGESPMRKALSDALDVSAFKNEYYLNSDGEIYIKAV